MHKEFSPEEKLLDLIKKKKRIKTPPKKDATGIPDPHKDKISPKDQMGMFSTPSIDLSNIIKLKNIRALNAILFITLICVIIYFLIDIFLTPSKEITLLEEEFKKPPKIIEEIEISPYSHYSKELNKAIFKPLAKEELREAELEVPIEELMGSLALLGIVSGENPQAIIENKRQKKTFFLREGQSGGGIFLKRIADGTVTVIYKGEEFSLTL